MTHNSEEEKLFNAVLEHFQNQYPHRNITLKWDYDRWIVTIDGETHFTTLGYNLLYNLTRLCRALEDELY